MHHVGHVLALSPLFKLMHVHLHVLSMHKLSAGSYAIPVVPGGGITIALIKLSYPLIYVSDFCKSVVVTMGGGPIVGRA